MTTLNRISVLSVDGPCLSLHAHHTGASRWQLHFVPSRTEALHFLWEGLLWVDRYQRASDGSEVPVEQVRERARASPLWEELGGRDMTDEDWNRANVGRFVSCVGVVDRQHFDETWWNTDEWPDDPAFWETIERPQATFLIAVTDTRWLAHLAAGMEWDSVAWDHDSDLNLTFDPAWRTSTVVALAAQMYDSRDFSAMPILADALQDAGCDHTDILTHCRGDGPHVRGCWVVDLVLGKE